MAFILHQSKQNPALSNGLVETELSQNVSDRSLNFVRSFTGKGRNQLNGISPLIHVLVSPIGDLVKSEWELYSKYQIYHLFLVNIII